MRLNGKAELGETQNEEIPPALLYQNELIPMRQANKGGNTLGPFDGHKQNSGGGFTDRVNGVCRYGKTTQF